MRSFQVGVGVLGLALVGGCGSRREVESTPSAGAASPVPARVRAGRMPANTVVLSAMMQQLSARPGFTEAFLADIQGGAKKSGAALLTPELVHHLRDLILGKNWQGLDHFPGWTMGEINPTVRVIGHVAGKDEKVEGMATAGGAPGGGTEGVKDVATYLDLGDYAMDKPGAENLDVPAKGKGFDAKKYVSSLGDGVTRGDGPNWLAPLHAESTRLAEVLNRLSLNGFEGVPEFMAQVAGRTVRSPEELVAALLASGYTVELADSRYFANFGHLHFNGQDVMMPFYVNTEIAVPEVRRPLLVPVAHAEYEWKIQRTSAPANAPGLKQAAVSFYFGIDGKAEWRTMDQMDQAWVMNRHAHEYRNADAVEVTRLNGAMVRAYAHLHQAHPKIPFGGYYGFGVCQDEVAAIELKMTGKATLFPNTAEDSFFDDPRDAEVDALIKRLPKDRNGRPPDVERIFGSLPVGSSDAELAKVSIPGLGADLVEVHDAWKNGTLRRTGDRVSFRRRIALVAMGIVLLGGVIWLIRRSVDDEAAHQGN